MLPLESCYAVVMLHVNCHPDKIQNLWVESPSEAIPRPGWCGGDFQNWC